MQSNVLWNSTSTRPARERTRNTASRNLWKCPKPTLDKWQSNLSRISTYTRIFIVLLVYCIVLYFPLGYMSPTEKTLGVNILNKYYYNFGSLTFIWRDFEISYQGREQLSCSDDIETHLKILTWYNTKTRRRGGDRRLLNVYSWTWNSFVSSTGLKKMGEMEGGKEGRREKWCLD